MEPWAKRATELFHEYRGEADKYAPEKENVGTLALINAGKAIGLHRLLEDFGHKPDIPARGANGDPE